LCLPEDRQAGLVQILFDCLKRWRIVESSGVRVNPSFCVSLCMLLEMLKRFSRTRFCQ